jgi:3-deoxy-manno-octulosonate cytidylyltransferase (CMP-KDO synthetase)
LSSPFTVVIPARFASQRFPGKPLIDLAGKPMIQRVYEQALLSRASRVVVATDDQRIADVVKSFDGEYCMTRVGHVSGTDRVQEVTSVLGLPLDHLVINVQGDEPLIPPEVINQVADILEGSAAPMATLAEPIETLEDLMDPNIVKVVTAENGDALYFSRAPIPWDRDSLPDQIFKGARRHIGIYGYRVSLLNDFITWQPGNLEKIEKLEQLRIMEQGVRINVASAVVSIPPGIDTASDLERTLAVLAGQ